MFYNTKKAVTITMEGEMTLIDDNFNGGITMYRLASVMQVDQSHYDEYKRRHDEIWPEMVETLKAHGATNYSIFLHEATGQLFAYLEVADKAQYAKISETSVCQKWWAYMKDIMDTNEDNSPVSTELKEMFYLA